MHNIVEKKTKNYSNDLRDDLMTNNGRFPLHHGCSGPDRSRLFKRGIVNIREHH